MKSIKMILTNGFDPDPRVYKEAKTLVQAGYDVEILCWDRENDYIDREVEIVDGIRIKRFFPFSKYGTGYKQVKAYIQYINEIKKYLKNEKYDYLHCHDIDGALAGYLVKNKNSKFIFDMHEFYEGQDKKQRTKFIVRLLVNFIHDKSNAIIYVNDVQKTTMKKSNLNKLVYLPNYPEKENYLGCRKSESENLRISYIGVVRQYNELKNLMDACREMQDVRIAIHGSGVSYKRLKEIENEYYNVEITGRYHFSQSSKLYSQADILYAVYDLSIENWKNSYPVKFFEAIITKTPIIVSKGSALEDFLNEYDIGFAVDGSNISEIRDLIDYINKNRYLLDEKVKNLEKIQYNYSWEEIVKNLDKVYKI